MSEARAKSEERRRAYEEVGGLEVAVHDDRVERVQVVDAEGSRAEQTELLLPGELDGVVGQDVLERALLHELCHDAQVRLLHARPCDSWCIYRRISWCLVLHNINSFLAGKAGDNEPMKRT